MPFFGEASPERLFGADAVLHLDMRVMSPIVLPLGAKVKCMGTGVALPEPDGEVALPLISLAFENIDAGQTVFRGWRKKVRA